ncbi:MAG TPA: site-specific DNA-methyltransferase [Candidatus Lokiarchaeia archaeon]|nr:site-specific DNA-methyltransferase [Candidatus Lokiarchaeia archaeon]
MLEKKARKRKSTETSAFGTSGREGHDSSKFYSRNLYDGQQVEKNQVASLVNPFPHDCLDSIILSSSENMKELPDNCVQLMVTSPPYDVGKEYDINQSLDEYLEFLKRVWIETYRVLVPGGRACINIANLGRKPYIPLHSYIIKDLQAIGFLMRGEIIWDKGASAGTSTAWGSWCSATNPTLRDVHEYILVFSKESFSRDKKGEGKEREDTIPKEHFLEYTKSIWSFPTESAKKIGHPAPFPVELPSRAIELYTFKDDVILDPFMGSGQTALAALKLGRHFVGYEINAEYKGLAEKRIKKCWQDINSPTLLDFQQK